MAIIASDVTYMFEPEMKTFLRLNQVSSNDCFAQSLPYT